MKIVGSVIQNSKLILKKYKINIMQSIIVKNYLPINQKTSTEA